MRDRYRRALAVPEAPRVLPVLAGPLHRLRLADLPARPDLAGPEALAVPEVREGLVVPEVPEVLAGLAN